MIEVKNLNKRYGSFQAVDNLSFSVEKGQILGFLGPNGAGKSTTMNMITGYLAADDGEILICGDSMTQDPSKAKRHIGYLPEIPPLYGDMTPREYLAFAGQLKGLSGNVLKEEITRVMTLTDILTMEKRLIKNLSKGYRQRVGFSCALLGDPEVIILDEPTVGLDPMQMIEFRNLVRNLGRNHAVILSSHILSEISSVCDRALVIAKGKQIAMDSIENLMKLMQGSHIYEADILGSSQKIEECLSQIAEIRNINIVSDEKCCHVQMEAAGETDPREKLFRALAKADLPMIALSSRRVELENVFLDLVEGKEEA